MKNTFSFPSLGIEFDALKYPFFIGDYGVTWTLVFLIAALLAGGLVFVLMAKKHKLDKSAIGLAALALLIGLVGARLVGVLIGNAESNYYSGYSYYSSLGTILDLGDGRLPLYGGLIFGLLGAKLLCRGRKVCFSELCDTGVFGLTAGIFVARIGNLLTQSYFGNPTETALFGMKGNIIDENMQIIRESALSQGGNPFECKYIVGMPVHPVFLYEMFACIAIFALLFMIHKKAYFKGQTLLAFLTLYGGCRAVFEGMRLDTQAYGLLRPYQIVGAFCCVAGIIAWLVLRWQAVEGNLGALSLYREKATDDGFGNHKTVKSQPKVYTAGDAEPKGSDGFGDLAPKPEGKTYTNDDPKPKQ